MLYRGIGFPHTYVETGIVNAGDGEFSGLTSTATKHKYSFCCAICFNKQLPKKQKHYAIGSVVDADYFFFFILILELS